MCDYFGKLKSIQTCPALLPHFGLKLDSQSAQEKKKKQLKEIIPVISFGFLVCDAYM